MSPIQFLTSEAKMVNNKSFPIDLNLNINKTKWMILIKTPRFNAHLIVNNQQI